MLDQSGSMLGYLEYMQTFARELVLQFQVSSQQARIGIVTFADNHTVHIGLSEERDRVVDAIYNLTVPDGGTSITSGLLAAKSILESSYNDGGPRAGVPRVIMILTDGRQNDYLGGDAAAIQTAVGVKAAGIQIYSLGFGTADAATITAMASTPDSQFAYFGASLQTVSDQLAGSFCTLVASPREPPIPPMSPSPPSAPSPSAPPPPPPSPPEPSSPPVPPPDDDILMDLDPLADPPAAKSVELRAAAAHYLYFSGSAGLVRPGDVVRLLEIKPTADERADCAGAAAADREGVGGILDDDMRIVVRLPVGLFAVCIAQAGRVNASDGDGGDGGDPLTIGVMSSLTMGRRLGAEEDAAAAEYSGAVTVVVGRRLSGDAAVEYTGNWSGADLAELRDHHFLWRPDLTANSSLLGPLPLPGRSPDGLAPPSPPPYFNRTLGGRRTFRSQTAPRGGGGSTSSFSSRSPSAAASSCCRYIRVKTAIVVELPEVLHGTYGPILGLTIAWDDRVEHVKMVVHDALGIPPEEQELSLKNASYLYHAGKMLHDGGLKLRSYGLRNNAVLLLHVREPFLKEYLNRRASTAAAAAGGAAPRSSLGAVSSAASSFAASDSSSGELGAEAAQQRAAALAALEKRLGEIAALLATGVPPADVAAELEAELAEMERALQRRQLTAEEGEPITRRIAEIRAALARVPSDDGGGDAAAAALDASELRRQLSEAHECLLAVTRAVLSTCEIVLPSTSTASIAVDVLEGDAGFDGLVVPPRTQSEVSQPTLLDKVLSLVSLERRTKASLSRASCVPPARCASRTCRSKTASRRWSRRRRGTRAHSGRRSRSLARLASSGNWSLRRRLRSGRAGGAPAHSEDAILSCVWGVVGAWPSWRQVQPDGDPTGA